MPIDLVLTHPAMFCVPGSVYRGVVTITAAYWLAGCPPSPLDDATMQHLAKMPAGHWTASRDGISAILEALLPELQKLYHGKMAQRESYLAQKLAAARRGGIAAQAKRRALIVYPEKKTKSQKPALVTPSRAPAYVDKSAAEKPRDLAAITARNPPGGLVARLRD